MQSALSEELKKVVKDRQKELHRQLELSKSYSNLGTFTVPSYTLSQLIENQILLLDTVLDDMDICIGNRKTQHSKEHWDDLIEIHTESEILNFINETMLNMGLLPSLSGFDMIKQAIVLMLKHDKYSRYITCLLYPKLGESFNTTPSRVERNIRHSIVKMFDRQNENSSNYIYTVLKNVINHKTGKCTNSEFLTTFVNYVYHSLEFQS